MSLLTRIFGKDKIVESAISAVDSVVLTDEERAEYFLKMLKAYEPFKLIQRVLAFAFTGAFLGVFLLSAVIFCLSLFFAPCAEDIVCKASQLQNGSKMLSDWNIETLGFTVSLIAGLFFGGGMAEGVINSYKSKK